LHGTCKEASFVFIGELFAPAIIMII
jgi:hypothetical protein